MCWLWSHKASVYSPVKVKARLRSMVLPRRAHLTTWSTCRKCPYTFRLYANKEGLICSFKNIVLKITPVENH